MDPPTQSGRLDQLTLNSTNGHNIGFAEYGISDGLPVLYFHGLPGSRLEASLWDDTAKALNIRLIAPDRPGMGLSTHDSNRVLTDYPDDVAMLVKHLRLEKYFIMGVSGGGMYALACAAAKETLPGLQGIAVVGGLGPRNLTQQGMGVVQKLSFHAMDYLPTGAVEWLWDILIGKSARNPDPAVLEKAIKKGGAWAKGSDAEYYKDEKNIQNMADSLRGGFVKGSKGYAHEATIVSRPWGFKLEDITIPVRLWYGGKDDLAPLAVGKAITEITPGAVFRGFEDETHIGIVMKHQKDVLTELTMLEEERNAAT